ncbi:MAG: 16S rRNA (adenine(1518)-N(6)/adenine(1519)-N(6))-dimethyltransferase RsmA [Bacteroidales bacterium]|nr:16S rRNA (adenine(1518)-N(6)/adenine(1519)-N(6))-dimethyltransferase RsmA [Bacteroidales bacterium]MCF8352621.1 16S rRNA (adenine(1518)-N(6)/adenine(1519)-N(6))-dimethyltransferase RsmA [Bacteroidales bacterium]MCF8376229.1 16S rRNA (adenine(1518)-N(6)/adenine(1519)-N(6))-dimethyltransferase RsmA [Bacteroidales bacterium]MCF8401214.1 16S rRNA (adenine(1518)-N(6)/adenine(1519)-N(6))-dimethyltransferase RsmA [Bacteroidales bacterium]
MDRQQVRPKKSLGQHFLKDENIARKIIGCISPETSNILEIGPGTGMLTKYLLQDDKLQPKFIETDTQSVAFLQENYPEIKEKIIKADFLNTDLKDFFENDFTIIGNFPYNISSQIFFKVLENRHLVDEVICMIQKEVAERISTGPGSKTYGILSVLLQAYYRIDYCFTVSEKVFVPPPRVKSAVIRLKRNKVHLECDEDMFFKIVKTAFNQRRKTLRNSLKRISGDKTLNDDIFNKRPENLGVDEFVGLTNLMDA